MRLEKKKLSRREWRVYKAFDRFNSRFQAAEYPFKVENLFSHWNSGIFVESLMRAEATKKRGQKETRRVVRGIKRKRGARERERERESKRA